MSIDPNALIEAGRAMVAQARTLAAEMDRGLSGARFVATADGGLVTAEADYLGRVTDIRIVRTGLTRTRAPVLAGQVVQAVERAREQAAAASRRYVGELLRGRSR